jgi:hypothetical protein
MVLPSSLRPKLVSKGQTACSLDVPLSLNASLVKSLVSHPATVPSFAVVNTAVLPSPAPATTLVYPFCVPLSLDKGSKVGENVRRESSDPASR